MRPLAALAVALGLLGPSILRAESFPFTAYVRAEGTGARSGPGDSFAATEKLDRGTEVSVFRRDPGGWLAIRPPDGSFDWVDGRSLKLDDEGRTAEATQSEVPVILGSRLAAFKADGEWQVKLERGETVEILGKKQVGDELWYKVAPPAGEFRWLREKEISREPPQPGDEPPAEIKPEESAQPVPAVAPVPAPVEQTTKWESSPKVALLVDNQEPVKTEEKKPASAPLLLTPLTPPAGPPATIPAAAAPIVTTPISGDGFVPRPKNGEPRVASLPAPTNPVTAPPATSLAPSGLSGGTSLAPRASFTKPTSDEEVQRELADIDIDLALVVAQDPARWQFDTLRQRAEACSDVASAPQLRGRTREMIQKLNEFDALRQRASQLATIAASTPARTAPPRTALPKVAAATQPAKLATPAMPVAKEEKKEPAPLAAATTATTEKPAADATAATPAKDAAKDPAAEFDGEGWLMPVITRRKDVPPFALTDDNGKLVGFVTPQPGVNLERYKKQKIGIKGQRGFIDEFNKPHVTAERVKVIEASKLR